MLIKQIRLDLKKKKQKKNSITSKQGVLATTVAADEAVRDYHLLPIMETLMRGHSRTV